MHEEWTSQLSTYLDDELPAEGRVALEAHLAGCEPCRAVLTELRAVVAWAPTFAGRAPERDLWPGIAATIERQRTVAFPTRVARRFSLAQLAAAAALMAVASGGTVWLAMRGGEAQAPALAVDASPTAGGVAAVPAALFDDPEYDQAVADLESVLEAGRTVLDTATIRVLEENLRIIDDAIAEARAAIEADPSNVGLGLRVQSHRQRKLVLLRQAAWAVGAST